MSWICFEEILLYPETGAYFQQQTNFIKYFPPKSPLREECLRREFKTIGEAEHSFSLLVQAFTSNRIMC